MPRVFRRTWTRDGKPQTSPWYSLEYVTPDGRKVRHQTDPRTTSARVAKEQLTAALALAGSSRAPRVLVRDILDAYGKHLETHSPSHFKKQGRYVLRNWAAFAGARPVSDFRLADVDEYVRELRGRSLSDSSLAAHLAALRAAFRRAVVEGVLPDGHPVALVRQPYQARERHVVWTDEELAAVSRHLPRWGRDLLAVLRLTGLRVGDALALRWEQVHGDRLALRQEKTGRPLEVPLSVAAQSLVAGIPREPECPFVFPSETLKTSKQLRNFRRLFLEACRAAGVAGKTIHDVRRTYSTALWNAGVPPAMIARLLGQGSTALVSRYTHAELGTMREAVEQGGNRTTGLPRPAIH